LFLAASGIVLSFPLGGLLALGRRSSLPAARLLSITYIEFFRGVPLIALLFMGALMLAFFLPPGFATPSNVIRAIVVFTIFTAAYIAEIVRGGLQSVPSGQTEASQALGMSPVKTTFFIVLPQALRNVIPALVGQFISLFKDTSLVSIIGVTEILRLSQIITQQEQFRGQGLITETLIFVAVIYWVGSFTMSRESQRLEKRLGVGER
jgi:general L-amino acid transport system permease protein